MSTKAETDTQKIQIRNLKAIHSSASGFIDTVKDKSTFIAQTHSVEVIYQFLNELSDRLLKPDAVTGNIALLSP